MNSIKNAFVLLTLLISLASFIMHQTKNDNKLIEGTWKVASSNDGEHFYVKKTDSLIDFDEAVKRKDMYSFMCDNQKFKFSNDGTYTQYMLDSAMYTMKYKFYNSKKILLVEGKNSLNKIKIDTLDCFLQSDTLNLAFPVGDITLNFRLVKLVTK